MMYLFISRSRSQCQLRMCLHPIPTGNPVPSVVLCFTASWHLWFPCHIHTPSPPSGPLGLLIIWWQGDPSSRNCLEYKWACKPNFNLFSRGFHKSYKTWFWVLKRYEESSQPIYLQGVMWSHYLNKWRGMEAFLTHTSQHNLSSPECSDPTTYLPCQWNPHKVDRVMLSKTEVLPLS